MQLVNLADAPDYDAGRIREGSLDSKLLLQGQEGRPNNYRVALTRAETEWAAPRHRHNFDQIRFPISGEFVYSKGTSLPAGWIGYFPEGAYYGPQLRQPGLQMLVIQFGGASGGGFLSRNQRKAARDALASKGTFKNGAFNYVDEQGKRHNQDAFEACWENATGRELTYPEPRYDGQIKINPTNFDWVPDNSAAGVAHKWLGTFTEREIRVGFIRADAGATIDVGNHDAPEFLFLVNGTVSHDGAQYSRHSAFGFEENEGPVSLKAEEASELLRVQMARF